MIRPWYDWISSSWKCTRCKLFTSCVSSTDRTPHCLILLVMLGTWAGRQRLGKKERQVYPSRLRAIGWYFVYMGILHVDQLMTTLTVAKIAEIHTFDLQSTAYLHPSLNVSLSLIVLVISIYFIIWQVILHYIICISGQPFIYCLMKYHETWWRSETWTIGSILFNLKHWAHAITRYSYFYVYHRMNKL